MCTVSMVGDHYNDIFKKQPWYDGIQVPQWHVQTAAPYPQIGRAEFEDLKRQVEEMKALLVRAKEYDERNGEPHCEMDEKVALLKKVAELVGVDLTEVFGNPGM